MEFIHVRISIVAFPIQQFSASNNLNLGKKKFCYLAGKNL